MKKAGEKSPAIIMASLEAPAFLFYISPNRRWVSQLPTVYSREEGDIMENEYVQHKEYDEYKERIDAEEKRQDKRLELLEESVKQNNELTVSVQKLATNMESMLKEQEKQGKRLDSLEAKDGEMWRNVCGYVVTAVIGILIGFVFTQMGL